MKNLLVASILLISWYQVKGDVADSLVGAGLTTLADFLKKADLVDTLNSLDTFTVFAPSNEAFAKLPQATVDLLTANPDLLKNTLLYHVIPGAAIYSSSLTADNVAKTAANSPIRVNVYRSHHHHRPNIVTANGKMVVKADVAPTPTRVVHVVSEVIPYLDPTSTIADVLTKDGRFNTLLAAVGAAELTSVFADGGNTLTLFAPTDDAFAKIDPAALARLLEPYNRPALISTLKRHVLSKALFARGISWAEHHTLNAGESLTTEVYKNGLIKIKSIGSSANVIDGDLVATNGVIHAIDTVL